MVALASSFAMPARADQSASAADRSRALEAGAAGAAAAARVLSAYLDQQDGEAGFAWWMQLHIAVRARLFQEPQVRLLRNRVELLRDAGRHDAASCAISGAQVLSDPNLGCEYASELHRYLDCIASQPVAQRALQLAALQPAPEQRLQQDQTRCGEAYSDAVGGARGALHAVGADPPGP